MLLTYSHYIFLTYKFCLRKKNIMLMKFWNWDSLASTQKFVIFTFPPPSFFSPLLKCWKTFPPSLINKAKIRISAFIKGGRTLWYLLWNIMKTFDLDKKLNSRRPLQNCLIRVAPRPMFVVGKFGKFCSEQVGIF